MLATLKSPDCIVKVSVVSLVVLGSGIALTSLYVRGISGGSSVKVAE